MTVGLHEEDEIARRMKCNVADGDVPVVWHEPRWSSRWAGKSVEVEYEILRPVSTKKFLQFVTCEAKLWPDHGSRYASWGALAN